MSKKTVRYTPEFKQQMVSLLHSGRSAASLSKEFGPTAWSMEKSEPGLNSIAPSRRASLRSVRLEWKRTAPRTRSRWVVP